MSKSPKAWILIVEDEWLVAESIRNQLEKVDFGVTDIVSTGKAAIKTVNEKQVDLLLMDIMLQGAIDGIETAGRIRATHDIPVVYLTACIDDEIIQRAKITGPFGYILKPFEERELCSVLEIALYKHQLETKVKESEEKYRRLINEVPVMVYDADSQWKLSMASPRIETITGYSEDEFIKGDIEWPAIIHPEDRERIYEEGRQMVDKLPELSQEYRIIRKNGETAWVRDSKSAKFNEQGFEGVHGIVEDISAHKQAEEERLNLEIRLRQVQKMEAVGELAGGVAHDFNNLLQAIMGYTDMAIHSLPKNHDARTKLHEVIHAGERASKLVRRLLTFSRRDTVAVKTLDICQLLKNIHKMLHSVLKENVELDIRYVGTLAAVRCDPGQLEQVIINLCINARDAMPGGGEISITVENIHLSSEYCTANLWASEGDFVKLSIADKGIGIPGAIRERIFEPFFTTKEPERGTGLGLAMVYGIIKRFNGFIHLSSKTVQEAPQDHGTRFDIFLPGHSTNEIYDSTPPPQVNDIPGGRETILLAEDDPELCHIASQVLEKAGYNVLTAMDGTKAVQLFETRGDNIHMAILDVIMPKQSGRFVYDAIKARNAHTPILFTTGHGAGTPDMDALPENCLMLIKPFKSAALLRKVRDILDGKEKEGDRI
ncbi:MAG: response regulator [bacterium]|nr:response regulator [bacterium]